jgi:hypothetical protein
VRTTWSSELTLPVSEERDHIQGPADASVTLLEYGDYECPYCGGAYPIIKQAQERLGDRLRFVFRNFPITTSHPHSEQAAEAAEAAAAQGKFWEMHDHLYEHQQRLTYPELHGYAQALGLDVERFDRELGEHVHADRVREDFMSSPQRRQRHAELLRQRRQVRRRLQPRDAGRRARARRFRLNQLERAEQVVAGVAVRLEGTQGAQRQERKNKRLGVSGGRRGDSDDLQGRRQLKLAERAGYDTDRRTNADTHIPIFKPVRVFNGRERFAIDLESESRLLAEAASGDSVVARSNGVTSLEAAQGPQASIAVSGDVVLVLDRDDAQEIEVLAALEAADKGEAPVALALYPFRASSKRGASRCALRIGEHPHPVAWLVGSHVERPILLKLHYSVAPALPVGAKRPGGRRRCSVGLGRRRARPTTTTTTVAANARLVQREEETT